MKRLSIAITILLLMFSAKAQHKIYSTAELQRLADLGKMWGVLNYFHPAMGTGEVNTDSLIRESSALLIKDASPSNFRTSINLMLSKLKDPATRIIGKNAQTDALLFIDKPGKAKVHKLNNGTWLIAMPTISVNDPSTLEVPGILPGSWIDAKSIILDLRNSNGNNPYADMEFIYTALPMLKTALLGNKKMPDVYERSTYHNGFVQQNDGSGNIYYSGWRTETKGFAEPATTGKPLNKPVAIIINVNTSTDLVKTFLTLQSAGACIVVYEGTNAEFTDGTSVPVQLTDSLQVSTRVSYFLTGKNKRLPAPAMFIGKIADTSVNGTFVQDLSKSLFSKTLVNNLQEEVSLEFILPKPGRYANNFLPSAELRLYGLYNWWNAIHYFYPYKHLIGTNWDSVLLKYIPIVINARDTLAYTLAVRSMVSEIHDSHGFLSAEGKVTPIRKPFGYFPPVQLAFIEDKLWIVDIGKDTTQNMNLVHLWDEVISIDGKNITESKNRWRSFFATSNEATFHRDVINYLPNGVLNSTLTLDVLREGKPLTVQLKRTGRVQTSTKNIEFNDDYPFAKMLTDSVAYINMGLLSGSKVDSVFTAFANTKAMVFDIRNYPQGTAWAIAPKLTTVNKPAVKFVKPMVNYSHINGGEDKENSTSFFSVIAEDKAKAYNGKIIILCNASTQSQAEYSIMMYQAAGNTTVIGNQTAGADGNVTSVLIPGGYTASFSGLEVLYPDGQQTQRTGIKIDIPIKPSVNGLKKGKDELMERAMEFISTGK